MESEFQQILRLLPKLNKFQLYRLRDAIEAIYQDAEDDEEEVE